MKKTGLSLILLSCVPMANAEGVSIDLLSQAQQAQQAGNSQRCFDQLAAAEFEQAGNVEYDYLLGSCALDSGQADRASLALERVLAVNPLHMGARLDLARAYFALGDYSRAKNEFELVKTQDPPPVALKVTEQYLERIEQQNNPRSALTGYAAVTTGFDTNVNAARDNSEVRTAWGPTLQLLNSPTAVNDQYMVVAAGGVLNVPLGQLLSLQASVDATRRANYEYDIYNTANLSGRLGVSYNQGENQFQASLQHSAYEIDDIPNNRYSALSLEWRHNLNSNNVLSVFAQYGDLSYQKNRNGDSLAASDVRQSIAGLSWLHALNSQSVLFSNFYAGVEDTTNDVPRFDGNQKFAGLRLGGQTALSERWSMSTMLGYKQGEYQAMNPVILDQRRDQQVDAQLALNWIPAKNWSFSPKLNLSKTHSNVDWNTFDRLDSSITVRYDF